MKKRIIKFLVVMLGVFLCTNLVLSFNISSVFASKNSLVGYWSFNEGNGTVVYDGSTYGNDGIVYGAVWTNGKFGNALSFDGIDDYVEVPDDDSLDLSTMTLEAWIFLETPVGKTNQSRIIEHKEKVGKAYGLELFAKDYFGCSGDQLTMHTTLNFSIRNAISPTHINTYQWYHVVGTYDGEYQKLYINGVLDKTVENITGITANISGPVLFGTGAKQKHFFDGVIDEVRVYNHALSADVIYQHYLGNFNVTENGTPGFTTSVAIVVLGVGILVALLSRRH